MLTAKELEVLRRRARGETQQQVAKALAVSQAAVSKFETNGHRKLIDAELLIRVSKTIGIVTEEGTVGRRVVYLAGRPKKKAKGGGGR